MGVFCWTQSELRLVSGQLSPEITGTSYRPGDLIPSKEIYETYQYIF